MPPNRRSRPAWFRQASFALGLVLLGAAVWVVVRDRATFETTLQSLRSAPVWLLALLFVLPAGNWLLTSEVFRLLMKPGADEMYTAPGAAEMRELIGAAWLANYLPVRPGLFGRVAWHKAHGGIPVARSVHSILCAIAGGVLAVTALVACAWAVPVATDLPQLWTIAALLAPPVALVIAAYPAGRVRPQWRHFLLAAAVRCADVLVWMARYWVVFAIAGDTRLHLREAAAIAAVSQAASMIPFAGNGLGVRETAVGLMGAWLPAWYATDTKLSTHGAIAADVVNRAGELVAALVVGAVCGVLLTRRANAGDRT